MPANPALRPIRWVYDKLREAFQPRQEPRSAPTVGVFDPPYRCLIVNQEWASHVIGMIDVLTELDAWAGSEAQQETAIQEVEKLLNALALGNCDEMAITDIRVNGCTLEAIYNDSGIWTPVGDLTACAVPGPEGPPGEDGREIELRSIAVSGPCVGQAIEWRYVGESTWQQLGVVCDGTDGTDGATGPPGADGREIELQSVAITTPCEGQLIQWRYVGDASWVDLGTICNGADGAPGDDGREVELQKNGDWLQWRYVGELVWEDLYKPITCDDCRAGSYGPVYPRPDPDPGADLCCIVAEAYMLGFEDYVQELDARVAGSADAAAIASGLLGFFATLAAIGSGGLWAPAAGTAFAISSALAGWMTGMAIAAIDNQIKAILKCLVYCNCPADGVYTQEAYETLLDEINAYPWGVAFVADDRRLIVSLFAEAIGVVGINNEPAVYNVTSGDCSNCNCDGGTLPCPVDPYVSSFDGAACEITIEGGGWISIESVYEEQDPNYQYHRAGFVPTCCVRIVEAELINHQSVGVSSDVFSCAPGYGTTRANPTPSTIAWFLNLLVTPVADPNEPSWKKGMWISSAGAFTLRVRLEAP